MPALSNAVPNQPLRPCNGNPVLTEGKTRPVGSVDADLRVLNASVAVALSRIVRG
jgi:hypothetical protein